MKKIYLSLILTGLTCSGLYAQAQTSPYAFGTLNQLSNTVEKSTKSMKPTNEVSNKIVFWSEDFGGIGTAPASTPGPTFVTSNGTWTSGGTNGNIWKHSFYTSSGEWSTGTPAFASATATNGFMLFDADSVNFTTSPTYNNFTGSIISPTIDLTGAPSALLSFDQDFRYCCTGSHNLTVSVSTDGGSTWGTPFNVTAGLGANAGYLNNMGDMNVDVNISSQAAGNMIKLKFEWDGVGASNSHYYWGIDDLNISDLPTDDIQVLASWISGVNNEGVEYGRTPLDHVDSDWYVGSQVYNFGSNDQTNIVLTADFTAFTSVGNLALLENDSTAIIEQTETLTLTAGTTYTGTYTAVSDLETGGLNFGNNVGMREFAITAASTSPGSIYSQDGIGIYTVPVMSSIGTASFTGGEDGLVLAAMYHIKQSTMVSGIRVMLTTTGGNPTVPGGEVYGSIKDTSTFLADDMTALFNATPVTVTAAHITAGYVDLMFPTPITLNTGAYYAAAELYSNGNANDIRVRDDETVAQPGMASAIYIPGDQVYSNGTAIGVRMLMGDWGVGINENTLTNVSIYPNPSEGIVEITSNEVSAVNIEVYDMLGQVVLTKEANGNTTIDLSSNGTGIYMVKVSTANGSMVERVVIK